MPPHGLALRPRHALALGLLQGPTELLPVSSSAHTILVPVLARWPYGELSATLRKSFEAAGVQVHLDLVDNVPHNGLACVDKVQDFFAATLRRLRAASR